jgi:hypothetical protein
LSPPENRSTGLRQRRLVSGTAVLMQDRRVEIGMASDAVTEHRGLDAGGLQDGSEYGRDEFWAALIGTVDGWLRRYYGIREFTGDKRCLLRLAVDPAPMSFVLSDGTVIEAGAPVGALHLWNEHVPRFPAQGPDFGWACAARRQFVHTLRLLAAHAEADPDIRRLPAFRGQALLTTRLGLTQLDRIAERLGFEAVPAPPSAHGALRTLGDRLNVWCLTRAYNPAALPRQKWLRVRHELWIPRARLVALYGRGASRKPPVRGERQRRDDTRTAAE